MKLRTAGITGIGASIPERVVTNEDLEKIVDTSDEWIRTRTGIRERRRLDEGTVTSDLALNAAKEALSSANLAATDLDLIILATFSGDCLYPATACALQEKLGAKNAAAFDLHAMCSGFIYSLSTATAYVRSGMYDRILVVGAEALSTVIDYEDRNTCVLFGDAAGAVVVEADKGHEVLAHWMGTDGGGFEHLSRPAGGAREPLNEENLKARRNYLSMNGREIFKIAVRKFKLGIKTAAKKAGWSLDEIDLVVPHQVNTRILDAVTERLGIDKDKVFSNLEKYGNTSAASIPLALYEANKEGRTKEGSKVVFVAVGGGLTWGSVAVRW